MIRRILVCLIGFAVLLASAAWGMANSEQKALDAIEELGDAYIETLLAGDVEAYANLHTEDVIKMPPQGPVTRNRAELVAATEAALEAIEFVSFDIDTQEMVVQGDVAYGWCLYTWEARPRGGGDAISYDGKALSIYRKQSDGSWQISHDCYNSNVPPPTP